MTPGIAEPIHRTECSFFQLTATCHAVELEDCAELLPLLQEIYHGAYFLAGPAAPTRPVKISLRREGNDYVRESEWLAQPVAFADPVDAVCDLTVDINHDYVATHPGTLCLHSAAVEFRDGLFLLPATYRTGKSLLSIYLTYLGATMYTDDALPVTKNHNPRSGNRPLPAVAASCA